MLIDFQQWPICEGCVNLRTERPKVSMNAKAAAAIGYMKFIALLPGFGESPEKRARSPLDQIITPSSDRFESRG